MPINEYIPILKNSKLFANMSEAQIGAVLGCVSATVREYKHDEYILRYGDNIHSLYIVLEGHAVIFKEDYWGNSNVISKAEPPHIFGMSYAMSTRGVSEVNVCAENRTSIMLIDVNKLLDRSGPLCGHHDLLIRNLITVLSDRNIYLSEKIEHISQRRLRDKILSYLSDISKKKNSASFDIPFSRRQLADYLNADRSALSNELCKLRDEGVIRFDKNHFELL